MTIAIMIDPAVAMTVPHNIRPANHAADDTTGNRADRSGNNGAGAGTDGDAFQRSSLGRDGHRRQGQHEYSSLEDRAHDNLLG
jgi:hypothetical protein